VGTIRYLSVWHSEPVETHD